MIRYSQKEVESWPDQHRRCVECKRLLPFSEFHKHRVCRFGINTVCKSCRVPNSKKNYSLQTHEQRLWNAARTRSTANNLPFDIEVSDIVIPERCPILNTEFVKNDHQYTASLDRIDPSKGYTKGNVWVISNKANMMKGAASVEELKLFGKWIASL